MQFQITPTAKEAIRPERQKACRSEEIAHREATKFGKYADKYCAFINCKHAPLPEGEKVEGLEYWNALSP